MTNYDYDQGLNLPLADHDAQQLQTIVNRAIKHDHRHNLASLNLLALGQQIDDLVATSQQTAHRHFKYQYRLTLTTVENHLTIETKNHALIKLLRTLFGVDHYNQIQIVDPITFGQNLAWWVKNVCDNQSYYNQNNEVGTVDDWLLNFQLTWDQVLSGDRHHLYPYVSFLMYVIDFIDEVDGTVLMHDPNVSDGNYAQVLFDLRDSGILPHLNDPKNQIVINRIKLHHHHK